VEFSGSYTDALALERDGTIVLAGHDSALGPGSSQSGWLVRLDADGALDPSFGQDGRAESADEFTIAHVYANPDGGLEVLGVSTKGRVGLERYSASGVLDGSFGPTGVRWLPTMPGQPIKEVIDANGRIVVLDRVSQTQTQVERFLPSGAPDASFGAHGVVRLGVVQVAEDETMALTTAPNGSVIVAGATEARRRQELRKPARVFLAALTPAGKSARSFGKKGVSYTPFMVRPGPFGTPLAAELVLAIAPNRHILLATLQERRLVLADYTRAGLLDRSFGRGGVARSGLPPPGLRVAGSPNAIAFDAAGDPIIAGEVRAPAVDVPKGVSILARYTPNGRDCSFGTEGILDNAPPGGASAVAVQPDGRIVIAGWSAPTKAMLAARYMGGGTPRTCPGEPSGPKPLRHRRHGPKAGGAAAFGGTPGGGWGVGAALAFAALVLPIRALGRRRRTLAA